MTDHVLPRLPVDVAALLSAAGEALAESVETHVKGMKGVRRAKFTYGSQAWTACEARQTPSCARLVDVATEYRYEMGASGAVALLTAPRPTAKRKPKLPDEPYLRQYQAALWHGLGVVFVVDTANGPTQKWAPGICPVRGEFDTLAEDVHTRLRADVGRWIPAEDSREVEGLVDGPFTTRSCSMGSDVRYKGSRSPARARLPGFLAARGGRWRLGSR